jgi:hypothetical protein
MDDEWEMLWSPYDEVIYHSVLNQITAQDIVLEIGAGDLRLARRAARIARQVVAIEIQEAVIQRAYQGESKPIPENLVVQTGDARNLPFPRGTSVCILLMRHCRHFQLYFDKLKSVGCKRLITNARWRLDVEVIDLTGPRISYPDLPIGWYGCQCGATGFKTGPVDWIKDEILDKVSEVKDCPVCCPV